MSTRRKFLLATAGVAAAGTALVVGWGLMPVRQRLVGSQPLPAGPGQQVFNGWVKIASDDTVTVMVPKRAWRTGIGVGAAISLPPRTRARRPPSTADTGAAITVCSMSAYPPCVASAAAPTITIW